MSECLCLSGGPTPGTVEWFDGLQLPKDEPGLFKKNFLTAGCFAVFFFFQAAAHDFVGTGKKGVSRSKA